VYVCWSVGVCAWMSVGVGVGVLKYRGGATMAPKGGGAKRGRGHAPHLFQILVFLLY